MRSLQDRASYSVDDATQGELTYSTATFYTGSGIGLRFSGQAVLHIDQQHDQGGVSSGGDKKENECRVEIDALMGFIGEEVDQRVDTPPSIAKGDGHRDHHQRKSDDARSRKPIGCKTNQYSNSLKNRLLRSTGRKANQLHR